MFLAGFFGILQILVLPGLVARKYFTFSKNFFIHLATVMAVSLAANYLIAFALTGLGLFTRIVYLVIFVLETGWVIHLYRKTLLEDSLEGELAKIWNKARSWVGALFGAVDENESGRLEKILKLLFLLAAFAAALVAIEWVSRFFRNNLGSVFSNWDDVVSWNRWAVAWAGNHFPAATEDYPQLIPVNWAVIYLFLGTTRIQLFAKAIMPLFSLMMLFLLFGMGIQYKNAGFFMAVILLRMILKKFSGEFIASGYVDLPLAFMTLLALLILYECSQTQDSQKRNRLYYLAILIASTAAVIKQSGLFLLVGIILMGFFYAFSKKTPSWFRENRRTLVPILLIPAIVVVPWYAFKFFQIAAGLEASHLITPLQHSTQVHASSGLLSNILPGLQSLGKYFYIVLFMIPAVFVIEKFWRLVGVGIAIPFTILWAAYASYDYRNLTMMFPVISTVAGLGIYRYFEIAVRWLNKLHSEKLKVRDGIVLLLAGLIGLSIFFTGDRLMQQQIDEQKKIFSPSLNEQLYTYFETHPFGKILTNYPVDYLPDMDGLQVNFYFQNYQEYNNWIQQTDVQYLLYPANSEDEIVKDIENQIGTGRMEFLFENEDYIRYKFVKILSRP